jgi:hypothetical protein
MKKLFLTGVAALLGLATQVHAQSLGEFRFTPNAAISGFNTQHLNDVSPDQCATTCRDAEHGAWCVSIDYFRSSRQCDLSNKRAADVGGLKTDYAGNPYDHYSLSPVVNAPDPIPGKRHVLVIGIDGLRGDAVRCTGCANPPALNALIDGGAFHANMLAGGPQVTLSGPGWASNFTGYWAADHGVTSNDITQVLKKPHVFDLIKQAYPTATTAVVADWANLTQGLLPTGADFVSRNDAKNSQQATDVVKEWLSWDNAPTAIFYYLHNVDIHTCCYDPKNAVYQQKILNEDAQIAQVLNVLIHRPDYANEDWLIVVASDHGGLNDNHGGQSASERDALFILNNTYGKPANVPYCRGDLTSSPLTQIDGVTPHVLDFLGIANPTAGRKLSACGASSP